MLPHVERDAMHSKRKLPPYSGALLGALVKAFDLSDEAVVGTDPAVGGKYAIPTILDSERDTTIDYFRGKRPIKPSTEAEILEAVGRGLVRSGVLPKLLLTTKLAKQSPDDPVEKLYLLGLQHFLESWDGVRGAVSSLSASVSDRKLAALPFLRLFGIDLSIRASAMLLLSGLDLSVDGSPAWAREQGRGWLLHDWIRRAGRKAPKQADLARKLTGQGREASSNVEVSSQAVGNWLAGRKPPSVEHQTELARVFAGLIENSSEKGLLAEMRRFYGLWSLCAALADVVGWQIVEETALRVYRYIADAQSYIKQSGDPREAALQECLTSDLWMGIWKPGGEHGNASLTGFMEPGVLRRGPWTRLEQDPVWKTDLYVCGKTAKLLSGHVGVAIEYGIHRRLMPFVSRIQHCYQRAAGWEAVVKAYPQIETASLQPPLDRESAFKLMNSYHALWPHELAEPWTRLAHLYPFMLANHFEQLASDEQFWENHEEAVRLWKLAVQHAPDDAYKLLRLGALYGEMGEVEKAAQCLQRASDLAPTWPQPALEFGRVLLHVGQFKRALEHLNQLPQAGMNDHVFGQYLLGNAHAANGNLREAASAFRRLTELQPDNAGAYADASLCLLDALKANPNAADRKWAIEQGPKWAKEADLRGDSRAKVAWDQEGKKL